MSELLLDEFWWNNITGPHVVVTKVTEALLDRKMVVLAVPADLPWHHSMLATIHTALQERLDNSEIVIQPIDIRSDNPDGSEPGRFILNKFASTAVSHGYREKSSISIQEYITTKNVIRNCIIWVEGLNENNSARWIQFCRGFKQKTLQDGLFVLEIQGKVRQADFRPLELVVYNNNVSSYDVQLFNGFILDEQNRYSDIWKKYIATVAAAICDTDAEISSILIDTADFEEQPVLEAVDEIAGMPYYEERGLEGSSGHVLWHCRNKNTAELEHRLWSAQVQVLFPLIELERISLIEKWRDKIQEALDKNNITQYNELITDASDVELGCLCYMMKQRTDDGFYVVYIPDEEERNWISFLHECRNRLAHADCCTPEQINRLLSQM